MIPPKLVDEYAAKLACGEQEAREHITQVIHDVCLMLSNTYQFGYHLQDDIYQEAYAEALIVLNRDVYNIAIKPLGNFLYAHIRNRLSNLKRKQLFRSEAPCKCCDAFNPGPNPCKRWIAWNKCNETKQRLMRPMTLAYDAKVPAPHEDVSARILLSELRSYILDRLPSELHEDFECFAAEGDLPKARHALLLQTLHAVLEDSPYAPE
jgi:hypothetical protein